MELRIGTPFLDSDNTSTISVFDDGFYKHLNTIKSSLTFFCLRQHSQSLYLILHALHILLWV